jgi:hypothetical protein
MLISVLGFGSIWTVRPAPRKPAAYFNTTGVIINGHLRNRPRLYGVLRFNEAGGFRADRAETMRNRVFECEPPADWNGERRLLCRRMLNAGERPDAYLVTVTADDTGGIVDCHTAWRHAEVEVVSFSESDGLQEVMLVMPAHTWIRGQVGTLFLEPDRDRPWRGRLIRSA